MEQSRLLSRSLFLLFLFGILCWSCGDTEETASQTSDAVIVISEGNVFATPDITAPSGGTVAVINNDEMPHTVTSESAENAFDDTDDFDLMVAADSSGILTLPEAPSGTVFFYYCRFHTSAMSPANGTITIE